MPSMKAIKRRIGTVKNIQQIMKAMNLVATSKVQKNRAKLMSIRPMFDDAKLFIESGVHHEEAQDSLYYVPKPTGRAAYAVICGDRGLCGSYNSNILKETLKHMGSTGTSDDLVVAIGSKAKDYFSRRGKSVVKDYKGVVDHLTYQTAADIAKQFVELYTTDDDSKRVDALYVAYTQFHTLLSHTPVVVKILPFEEHTGDTDSNKEMIYEPDVLTYLKKAVPIYISMYLYGAMTEAAVCEYASKMTSMDAASRNAGEIVDKLTLQYNRQRQGAITQEISEIVGGANAI